MKDLTDQLLEIKRNVERMKQNKEQACGALSQVMKQIRAEFKCENLDDAEELLSKMKKQLKQDKEQLEKSVIVLKRELDEHAS